MQKKWVLIVIGLLLVSGIGGKVYLDKKEAAKEAEKIEAERMSVVALKNKYADIKSVEFEKSGYDEMTGAYAMFVIMTNQKNESVKFSFTFWKEREEIGSAGVKDREVQVKGVTTNEVRVIYSNRDEGEV